MRDKVRDVVRDKVRDKVTDKVRDLQSAANFCIKTKISLSCTILPKVLSKLAEVRSLRMRRGRGRVCVCV